MMVNRFEMTFLLSYQITNDVTPKFVEVPKLVWRAGHQKRRAKYFGAPKSYRNQIARTNDHQKLH